MCSAVWLTCHIVDWTLYGHLVQATIGMLNKMGSLVSAMLSKSKCDLLAPYDVNAVHGSEYVDFWHFEPRWLTISPLRTAYETAFAWLSRINDQGDTEEIATDLKSHINIGQGIPSTPRSACPCTLLIVQFRRFSCSNIHSTSVGAHSPSYRKIHERQISGKTGYTPSRS